MLRRISLWIENIVRRSLIDAIIQCEQNDSSKNRVVTTHRNPNQFDHVEPGTEWINTQTKQSFLYKVRWEEKKRGEDDPEASFNH